MIKSKIKKQIQKKTNTELVKTILAAKKHGSWIEVAKILSNPRRKRININLFAIPVKKTVNVIGI